MCEITNCPYYYKGLCSEKALRITNQGTCHHLTKKNWSDHIDDMYKEIPNVYNIIKREETAQDNKQLDDTVN